MSDLVRNPKSWFSTAVTCMIWEEEDWNCDTVLALVEVWESETPKNGTMTSKIRCLGVTDFQYHHMLQLKM